MKTWRIVLGKFGRTNRAAFGGLSGFSVDGRWHTAGRHLDYAAQSLSLAILERLVYYKRFDALEPHVLYVVDVPDAVIESAPAPPHGWDGDEPVRTAQAIGDNWYDERRSPALVVPSVVTPGEYNLMINPRHPDWQWRWVISGPVRFAFDVRLAELVERSQQPTSSQ
ncbi:MAG: RES family NAD+ phosphorylase [Proteobacteria bacterium]|nr:RES family NAD+ phosphorylase [Pseudomonadota bacterium]